MSEIEDVKNAIQRIENELIQRKEFIDTANQPKFVTNLDIENETGLSDSQVVATIQALETREFMIFDNNLRTNPDPKIKFFIRSRTYHLIWTLYRSTNRTWSRPPERDVADYQYVRHVKRTPTYNNYLTDIFLDQKVESILDHQKNILFDDVIEHIRKNTKYTGLSNFQKISTIKILKDLDLSFNKTADPGSVVIEAGTGFGKSWAYQFPLLLWILNKKIKKLNELRQGKIRPEELHVNCSALLIFPRNALAEDQFASISKIIDVINEVIAKDSDAVARNFLRIKKPVPDFHGKVRGKQKEKYGNNEENGYPDIIIVNAQPPGKNTLERRLSDPYCSPVFKNGIDLILYDEVHLYEGVTGSEVASINARLQNLLQEESKKFPVFVGMSATVDKAQLHCQKLFSLMTKNRPIKITQEEEDDTEPHTIEHHLILKPRSGRSPVGVAINTASCLIHNRRIGGLAQWHDDVATANNPTRINKVQQHKTISFIDSLANTSKFAHDLNNYEYFWAGDPQKQKTASSRRPFRGYLFHFRPEQRPPRGTKLQEFVPQHNCENCTQGLTPEIFSCGSYAVGECWYYSEDSAGQFNNPPYSNWIPKVGGDRLSIPPDNIRSTRVSSLSEKVRDKYDYFIYNQSKWIPDGLQPAFNPIYSDIDNVVATSTLEVGVDFENIKEIIQYGEIRSPSSYKQKAGRGAREGNVDDGLFVMSVINDSPLAYHHFKHFTRLVFPSLDPLKLEPANSNVIISNSFFSIFDFFALNGINLFRISKLSTAEVEAEYDKAKKILGDNKLEKYLERFFSKFNFSSYDIKEIIKDTKNFLEILSTKKEIEVSSVKETTSLHELLIRSVNELDTLESVVGQLDINILQRQGQATNGIRTYIEKLKEQYKIKFPADNSLDEKLKELEVKIFG